MSSRPIVAVIDHRFADLDIERTVLSTIDAKVVDLRGADRGEILSVAASADGILLGPRLRMGPAEINGLENCRVIARFGVGVDNVDIAAAHARGIKVTNVPDYCVEEVANHAVSLLLALHRNLFDYDQAMRAGAPQPKRSIARLSTCTLGVLGFGRIGREVVRRAKAFDLEVLVHDPLVAPSAVDSSGARFASMAEVISQVDFLTLHVPLTESTRHLLNAATLATMRNGAVVVNVSRGGLIDEEALANAIESGRLGGAGLDVSEIEPLPQGNRLFTLSRVVLTPHVAWVSTEAVVDLRRGAAEEVAAVLRGALPKHEVMPPGR